MVLLVSGLLALNLKIHLMQPAAGAPIALAVIQHDAEVFGLMLLLYSAGCALQMGWGIPVWTRRLTATLSRITFALGLLMVVLYIADALIYRFFVTRLYASDVVTFARELHAGMTLGRAGLGAALHHNVWKMALLALFGTLWVRGCFVFLRRSVRSPGKRSLIGLICTLLCLLVWAMPAPARFYMFEDKPLYENFLERNQNYFINTNFSAPFRRQVVSAPEPSTWIAGRNRRVNVVLLIVESLSSYQSHYFSGIEDWTPQLDEIARHETALPNFYANGWTTIGGLLSLLTGTFPLVPEHTQFNEWGSPRLPDFAGLTPSLPQALAKEGYRTEFIGAGDLDFTGKGTWLQDIGFEKTVGGNDPRFARQTTRGPFNSVPDHMLYAVALDELGGMPANQPYFAVIETFWTHRPFIDENGKHLDGEEPVFREADAQIGNLYRQLMASGFFENGVLMIVGDHRAPLPFRSAEFKRFGASAVARIPAILVTRAFPLPKVMPQTFQQRDVMASIESLVSNGVFLRPEEGSFLSDPPHSPGCILHARGDDRDLVFVKCGSAEGVVRVAGDRTRFVQGEVPDEGRILETINRTRARPPH